MLKSYMKFRDLACFCSQCIYEYAYALSRAVYWQQFQLIGG